MAKKEKKRKKDKLNISHMTDIEIKAEKDRIKSETEKRIKSKKRERKIFKAGCIGYIVIFDNNICNLKNFILTRSFYYIIRSKLC